MAKGTIPMFPISSEDRAKTWGKLLSLLSQIDEETEAAKIAAKASRELICELRAEVASLRKDLQDEGFDQRTGEIKRSFEKLAEVGQVTISTPGRPPVHISKKEVTP